MNNESGRSMVEMLGVLAIIGVLSVMGIAGYTQAMKKYHANEAAAEISMGAILCGSQKDLGGWTPEYLDNADCTGTNDETFTWDGYKKGGVTFDQVKVMFNPALNAESFKVVS